MFLKLVIVFQIDNLWLIYYLSCTQLITYSELIRLILNTFIILQIINNSLDQYNKYKY